MNSPGTLFTLMVYNLRLTSWRVWVLFTMALFFQSAWIHLNGHWHIFGHSYTDLNFLVFLLYAAIASAFFQENPKYGGGSIPYGEFLVSHTVSRPAIYYSRLALFFGFILAAPLLENMILSKPDMKIDFGLSQNDEKVTDQQIKFYQVVFPDSSIVHDDRRSQSSYDYKTLLIPSGGLVIAHWDLLVAISIALFIQWSLFSSKPTQVKNSGFFVKLIFYYFGVSILFWLMFPQIETLHGPSLFEAAFFYYAQYPAQSWLFLLGAFAFVQWIACRRAREIEIL